MPTPDLHLIAFSVPYPPNYGGAMEVWNRIRALHAAGVRIRLHCFLYGPYLPQDELKEVTQEVHYYPRSVWPVFFTKGQPFVISSRKNSLLLKRLREDKSPVFFEGMQTTGWVNELDGRKKLLRAHNVEHRYYNQLAQNSGGFRSIIFSREAQCLEEYESKQAKKFNHVFTISPADQDWFTQQGANSIHVPPFHGFNQQEIIPGTGEYMLYQGDLSIEINQRAVLELIRHIPHGFELPLVVAGRSGESAFESKIRTFPNIRREVDVTPGKMTELIRQAQLLLVHSLHAEGMKMKIYPSVYQGHHILANTISETKTRLDEAMHFYENVSQLPALLNQYKSLPFTEEDIRTRENILQDIPSDQTKAQQIIQYL